MSPLRLVSNDNPPTHTIRPIAPGVWIPVRREPATDLLHEVADRLHGVLASIKRTPKVNLDERLTRKAA